MKRTNEAKALETLIEKEIGDLPDGDALGHIAALVDAAHDFRSRVGTERAFALLDAIEKRTLSDFPGGIQYRHDDDDRFETYREHIQRHARLHAATTLVKSRPVARSNYDWEGRNPWQEFLRRGDVSFEDGSWLSDHKDRVPAQAREHLLGERKGNQETLEDQQALFRKVGFPADTKDSFLPLYGYWTSPDGVHVSLNSALINERGAVGQCAAFSKSSDHDLWLPAFGSDGRVDRYAKKKPFDPLIWNPEKYPIGIDRGDEWAARGAIERTRLGLAIIRILGLTPDKEQQQWHDRNGTLALKSEVWGEWKTDPNVHRSKYQDEGSLLWAERDWIDGMLKSCRRSLIFKLGFSKYKSSKSYDDSSGVRELYVGLKRNGEDPRFWFAKNAPKTLY